MVTSYRTKGLVRYSGMAIEMILIMGLFTFAGWKLDQWLNNEFPVFIVIFSLSGVCVGIYTVVRMVLKEEKQKKTKNNL